METTHSVSQAAESRQAKWRALIQEQRVSSQPIKAFCQARGVAVSTFFAWRRKLLGQAASDSARFVEVAVTGRVQTGDAGRVATPIELELREGHRVLVLRRGFDPALLREALAALEGQER